MKTCFACDIQFEHHLPSTQIKPEYCSLECQEAFEATLSQEIEEAKISGLVDTNGEAILGTSNSLSVEKIQAIVSQFSTKIPNKE